MGSDIFYLGNLSAWIIKVQTITILVIVGDDTSPTLHGDQLAIVVYSFKKSTQIVPRSMIPEAVFRESPAETGRKRTVSSWNPPGNGRNPVTVSGCRFSQVPIGSERNRVNSVTGSVHRNTASMKSPELS